MNGGEIRLFKESLIELLWLHKQLQDAPIDKKINYYYGREELLDKLLKLLKLRIWRQQADRTFTPNIFGIDMLKDKKQLPMVINSRQVLNTDKFV